MYKPEVGFIGFDINDALLSSIEKKKIGKFKKYEC